MGMRRKREEEAAEQASATETLGRTVVDFSSTAKSQLGSTSGGKVPKERGSDERTKPVSTKNSSMRPRREGGTLAALARANREQG
eukprot:NODE_22476_length_706_cov_5.350604.p4 GENE.NODE_22476_length_706_cov_5.350604~~NODE_22476_length_706_cov_5.350604.p4  ORF type:complete len:85 (+),score=17.35 NODE_22476_length_706_cov_5.350604:81-335(+)